MNAENVCVKYAMAKGGKRQILRIGSKKKTEGIMR